jgi:cysteinyl-tRNA synthetase
MYCCGQTVYNDITMGNARSFAVFDSIRRYLIYKGYDVRFVLNFTDVDDKIIAKANDEGVAAAEIAKRYIGHTLEDMDNLNILPSTVNPRATEEMPEIIAMVQALVDKGYAYAVGGSVFFATDKSAGYGKLSGKNIDELVSGARVEVNAEKRSPADFVLWKPAKPGEPYWDSPWGRGRPGWHIECSAMSKKYLGERFDIHGGGQDLIFPHHENEIAQSEAANGCAFANYWMHNGLLTVGHKKMGKSLGNFVTLRDAAAAFPYDVIRFFLVSGHYRMPMEYGEHLLESAKSGLTRIKNCASSLTHLAETAALAQMNEAELGTLKDAEAYRAAFETAMDEDFNTADAVAAVFELVKFVNVNIGAPSKELALKILGLLSGLCDLLGIIIGDDKRKDGDEAGIEALIEARNDARKAKDWVRADRIRDELAARGVVLKDTPDGVRWEYR